MKQKIEKIKTHKFDHNGTTGHCSSCWKSQNDKEHSNYLTDKLNEIIDVLNKERE